MDTRAHFHLQVGAYWEFHLLGGSCPPIPGTYISCPVPELQLHRFRSLDAECIECISHPRRLARSRFNCPGHGACGKTRPMSSSCQSRKPGVLALVLSVNGRKSDLERPSRPISTPHPPHGLSAGRVVNALSGRPSRPVTECVRQQPWAKEPALDAVDSLVPSPGSSPTGCRPGMVVLDSHSPISPLTIPSSIWSIS